MSVRLTGSSPQPEPDNGPLIPAAFGVVDMLAAGLWLMLYAAFLLGCLYVLVRFIKWAWAD